MSFQQGLSGLSVSSKALDIISNNVANTNTIGFKTGSAIFSDVFAASLTGSISGKQVGVGRHARCGAADLHPGQPHHHQQPARPGDQRRRLLRGQPRERPGREYPQRPVRARQGGFHPHPTGEKAQGFPESGHRAPAHADRRPQGRPGADRRFPAHADQPGGDRRKPRCERPERSPALPTAVLARPSRFRSPAGENWQDARTYTSTSIKAYDSLKSHELTYYFAKVTPTPNDPVNTNENTWKVFTSVDGGYPWGRDRWLDRGSERDLEPDLQREGYGGTRPSSGRRLRICWRSRLPTRRVRTASVSRRFQRHAPDRWLYLITELTQDGYTGGELAGVSVGGTAS